MENSSFSFVLTMLILGLVCFVAYKILDFFKFPKVGAMCLISGGVKTGKSTFGVALSIREYKNAHRMWRIKKALCKMFDRKEPEEPLLYSNIPLAVPYVPLTTDIILRKKRVRYKSVIYICEASLVADSMSFRNMELNDRILLFNKLIGHSTQGGKVIYDTQSIADCHMGVKKCLSDYFYIHHLVKWLPGLLIAYIREERYSYDGSVVNTYDKDVEDCLTRVVIPKSTWKKFDCYCYSSLTDGLDVEDKVIKNAPSLKIDKIISFKDWDRYSALPVCEEKESDCIIEKEND